MNMEIFVEMLFGISLFTGLFTEAIKGMLDDSGISYSSNILAGIVAIVLSIFCIVAYVVVNKVVFGAEQIITSFALMALSWLSAMVGFDKIMQTIKQLGGK